MHDLPVIKSQESPSEYVSRSGSCRGWTLGGDKKSPPTSGLKVIVLPLNLDQTPPKNSIGRGIEARGCWVNVLVRVFDCSQTEALDAELTATGRGDHFIPIEDDDADTAFELARRGVYYDRDVDIVRCRVRRIPRR